MITYTHPVPKILLHSEAFNLNWKEALERLLSLGKSSGADLIEIFLENTDNLSILAEQDTITSVNPSFGKGAGIRVFRGNRDGFVSTNDLTENGLKDALTQALGMLGLDINTINEHMFEGLNEFRDYGREKSNWLIECPSSNETTNKLLLATDQIKQYGKHIEVRRSTYSRSWQEVLIASSDGTFAKDIRLHQWPY